MAKDAYYFSHDSNSRTDEKIIALLMKHKWEGYGLYWAIVEKLRDSTCYKLSTDFNLLAYEFRTTNELIKSIVTGFGLFTIDENEGKFWSNRLMRSMQQKSEKAQKAANKRWNNADAMHPDASAMQTHSKRNANGMQNDAIKGKESKVKKRNSISSNDGVPPSSPDDLLKKKKEDFVHLLAPYVEKYGKDMINAFYRYWTEPNKSKTKLRWELEKTWDISLRLVTWANNDEKFNKSKS